MLDSSTSYRVAHRYTVAHRRPCVRKPNVTAPRSLMGTEHTVTSQTYRTSSAVHAKLPRSRPFSSFYQLHPSSSGVHYMAHVDESMESHSHGAGKQQVSETKSNYNHRIGVQPRRLARSAVEHVGRYSDQRETYHQANNYTCATDDPYRTTMKCTHINFPCDASSSNDVTYWSKNTYPKIVAFDSYKRKTWMPLTVNIKHSFWGDERYNIQKHNKYVPKPQYVFPRNFLSETKKAFVPQFSAYMTPIPRNLSCTSNLFPVCV